MPEKFQTPRGFKDILPLEHNFFTLIKKVARHRFRQAGFLRISTSMLENLEVFARGIGADTDIVSKEMFYFESRSGKKMVLKPEGTAGVIRAFIEHGMQSWAQPVQLYYFEPHFRYERPQKGRFRQFWQCCAEVLGARDPLVDAQIIILAWKIIKDLKIADSVSLQINSLGSPADRAKFIDELHNFFEPRSRALCDDCRSRLQKNPLRILDCKNEDCQILVKTAPKLSNFLNDDSRKFYEQVLQFLTDLKVPFVENENLVRGLDYYCDTVFEFQTNSDGAQNAICGGGRYDGLCEILGGPATPAVGFAFGVERVIEEMKKKNISPPEKDFTQIFVACLGDVAQSECLKILSDLQDLGIHVRGAFGKSSMKSQLKTADRLGAQFCLILGDVEIREKNVILRNMENGEQENIPLDEVQKVIAEKFPPQKRDFYNLEI